MPQVLLIWAEHGKFRNDVVMEIKHSIHIIHVNDMLEKGLKHNTQVMVKM